MIDARTLLYALVLASVGLIGCPEDERPPPEPVEPATSPEREPEPEPEPGPTRPTAEQIEAERGDVVAFLNIDTGELNYVSGIEDLLPEFQERIAAEAPGLQVRLKKRDPGVWQDTWYDEETGSCAYFYRWSICDGKPKLPTCSTACEQDGPRFRDAIQWSFPKMKVCERYSKDWWCLDWPKTWCTYNYWSDGACSSALGDASHVVAHLCGL